MIDEQALKEWVVSVEERLSKLSNESVNHSEAREDGRRNKNKGFIIDPNSVIGRIREDGLVRADSVLGKLFKKKNDEYI